jgi:hypothetical protein
MELIIGMSAQFGDQHRNYQSDSWALVPFVY